MISISLIARYWREALFVVFVIPLAFMVWLRGEQLDSEKAAHKLTKAAFKQQVSDYRAAYDKARADAVEAARKVETEQERITHEVSADYQARLADVRARYSRLLAEANADSNNDNGKDLSSVSIPTGRIACPSDNNRLLEVIYAADENTIKLIALQNWVTEQQKVDRK